MTLNCVTDTALLYVKRHGVTDWSVQPSFKPTTETYTANCGALVANIPIYYNKVVGGVCVEQTAQEKVDTVDDRADAVDTANSGMGGADVHASRTQRESVGADVNLEWNPYVSIVTAYNAAIALGDGTRDGQLKKIYNDGTGSFMLVDCGALAGAATNQLRINNNQHAVLLWVDNGGNMTWRLYDGSLTGLTLQ